MEKLTKLIILKNPSKQTVIKGNDQLRAFFPLETFFFQGRIFFPLRNKDFPNKELINLIILKVFHFSSITLN